MLIDWFTVGAQIVNFLILVWLLKRFLYKPILNAIDVREKRIAADLADAEAKRIDAQKESAEFQGKNKAFDAERGALMEKAKGEAGAERTRLVAEAQKEADAVRASRESALVADQKRLGGEITRVAATEVLGIARKALSDLATASLEERMVEVFSRRLKEMDPKAKGVLAEAVKTSAEPALVRTTFGLPDGQKAAIQNALNEAFSAEVRVRFETSPDAICGIELTANGQKLAWTVSDYLGTLAKNVDALLAARSPAEPAPAPKPGPARAPVAVAAAAAP